MNTLQKVITIIHKPMVRMGWKCLPSLAAVLSVLFTLFTMPPASASGSRPAIDYRNVTPSSLAGHANGVTALTFSPDSTLLASGSWKKNSEGAALGEVKVWDTSTGNLVRVGEEHWAKVNALAFSPDSKWLASGSEDKTVRLWNVATGDSRQLPEGHKAPVIAVSFLDGRKLASGSHDGAVIVWDTQTGESRPLPLQEPLSGVRCFAFSRNGRLVAGGGVDRTIKVWDVQTGRVLATLPEETGLVTAVTFAPDNNTLAGSNWSTVRLYDVHPGTSPRTRALPYSRSPVWSLAFSPDSRTLAGSHANTIILWNARTRYERRKLPAQKSPVRVLAFATAGRMLASGGDDGTVLLWK